MASQLLAHLSKRRSLENMPRARQGKEAKRAVNGSSTRALGIDRIDGLLAKRNALVSADDFSDVSAARCGPQPAGGSRRAVQRGIPAFDRHHPYRLIERCR